MKKRQIIHMLAITMACSFGSKKGRSEDSTLAVPYTMTVVMTELTAQPIAQGNQIKWTTILETNLAQYIVEKSINSQPFTTVATVKAKGSNSVSVSYLFTDLKPGASRVVYRLKMVDTRGGFKYSEHRIVSGGSFTETSRAFHAYPNPVLRGAGLQIDLSETGSFMVRIVNMQGVIVHSMEMSNTHGSGLNLTLPGTMNSGMYMVDVIHIQSQQRQQQKIIVQ